MQPLYGAAVSGGGRGVDMGNRKDVLNLIGALVDQGARVEWSGGGGGKNKGGFPAKVYPPNPDKPMILFHGTASDGNAATLKRNEVRRAGLIWPNDKQQPSRKETTVAVKPPIPTTRAPGEHLLVPSGVRNRGDSRLSQSSLDVLRPHVASMEQPFWSDDLLKNLRAAGVPGFGNSSSMQRLQDMLDWSGHRVVAAKPNRNGFSYQWERDPVAEDRPGLLPVSAPQQTRAPEPAPAVDPEPRQAPEGFQVFERPKPGPKKHERVQCKECERWFTPDGYEHHVDSTGHDLETPSPVPEIEALRGEPVDLDSPQVEEPVDDIEVPTSEVAPEWGLDDRIGKALEYLRTTPMLQQVKGIKEAHADLVNLLVEVQERPREAGGDDRAAYERGLAEGMGLAEGAQEKVAALERQAGDVSEELGRLDTIIGEREARIRELEQQDAVNLGKMQAIALEVDSVLATGRMLTEDIENLVAQRDEAKAEIERLKALPAGNDDSWSLDIGELGGLTTLRDLMNSAEAMGVEFEIRARRAR